MPRIYDNNFKFMIVDLIVNKKNSTSKTAEKYGVPLKTLEKWITSYNKDKTSFGTENLTKEEQIKELKSSVNVGKAVVKKAIKKIRRRTKKYKRNNRINGKLKHYSNSVLISFGILASKISNFFVTGFISSNLYA